MMHVELVSLNHGHAVSSIRRFLRDDRAQQGCGGSVGGPVAMAPKKLPPPQPEPSQPPQKRGRKTKSDAGGDGSLASAIPDAYLVKVQNALSLVLDHPVFHKIVDAKPLSIKPEGKKGGGGWKVLKSNSTPNNLTPLNTALPWHGNLQY